MISIAKTDFSKYFPQLYSSEAVLGLLVCNSRAALLPLTLQDVAIESFGQSGSSSQLHAIFGICALKPTELMGFSASVH